MDKKQYTFSGTQGGREVLLPVQYGHKNLVTADSWFKLYDDTDEGRKALAHEGGMLAKVAGIPHVSQLRDTGFIERTSGADTDISPALKMPYYRGKTLEVIFRSTSPESFSTKEIVKLCEDILSALDMMEGKGIVHNDIQPRNILRTDGGEYLLIDFGNAVEEPFTPDVRYMKGAYGYVAKEKRMNETLGVRSDIFSFGMILKEFLVRGSRLGVKHPSDWPGVVRRCIEDDAEKRYAHFSDLHKAIMDALPKKKESNDEGQSEETFAGKRETPKARRIQFDWVIGLCKIVSALSILVILIFLAGDIYMLVCPADNPLPFFLESAGARLGLIK